MGEYAIYNGNQIKIGTAENMYYLRADQMDKVAPEGFGWTDDLLAEIRFRFPFPNEDHKAPGDFDNPDYGVSVYGWKPPAEGIKHYKVYFGADGNRGVRVGLPCPYSIEGKKYEESGLVKYMYNGYAGPVRLMQVRKWAGVWVPVLECGACGAKFRLPDLETAEPFLTALGVKAANEDGRFGERSGETDRGRYFREILRRIRMGFAGEIPGPEVKATV
jgi:hypothetical protein